MATRRTARWVRELITFASVSHERCISRFCAAVPQRAAEPAGQRPAHRGGARQAVQQHPGDRPPPHVPVEPSHAARPGEGQAGPGTAGPNRSAPRLQDGQFTQESQRRHSAPKLAARANESFYKFKAFFRRSPQWCQHRLYSSFKRG